MTKDLVAILDTEIRSGITKESQVVYLLAGIRKNLERDGLHRQYSKLMFHCNWALHVKLDRDLAQDVLNRLSPLHLKLLRKEHLSDDDTRGIC